MPRISLRSSGLRRTRRGASAKQQSEANSPHKPTAKSKPGRDAMRIIRFCVALLSLLCLALSSARAQEKYPDRPVHFIVSFAAGGRNHITARVLCDWLTTYFGQQFVVENRTGASGNVGAGSVI